MKKTISVSVAIVCAIFISSLIINQLNAQTVKKDNASGKPVPADVMKIFTKSCSACHSEPGGSMAMSRLNFTNWDKYSPEKQADKAKAICDQVTKGKMPQKSFISKHPDAVVSAEGLNAICSWSQSIQIPKK